MKILFFIPVLWLLKCSGLHAQDSLQIYNDARNHIKTTGMAILGSWGIANAATGTVGYFTSDGNTKYFHQMNAIWGLVNTGIAALGYIGTQKDKKNNPGKEQSLKEQKNIERVFLINGGLDLAYITGGIYLKSQGGNNNSDRLRGYGSSVIMQGAFLLLFDSTMYLAERSNGHKLRSFLQQNPLTFDGQKIGMLYNF